MLTSPPSPQAVHADLLREGVLLVPRVWVEQETRMSGGRAVAVFTGLAKELQLKGVVVGRDVYAASRLLMVHDAADPNRCPTTEVLGSLDSRILELEQCRVWAAPDVLKDLDVMIAVLKRVRRRARHHYTTSGLMQHPASSRQFGPYKRGTG